MKTVIFTTTSKNKIDDFKTFLEYKNLTNEINLLTLSDIHIPDGEAPEDCDTVEGNANQKLSYYFDRLPEEYRNSDTYLMSEDTGLFIDALGGAPGVKTARFTGSHDYKATNEKIMSLMSGELSTGRRQCTIKSCVSIVSSINKSNMYSEPFIYDDFYVTYEESKVPYFAFDSIVSPYGVKSVTLAEIGYSNKVKRLRELPRYEGFCRCMSFIGYICPEILG